MAKNQWRPKFLDALRQTGNVTGSAQLAGRSRAAVYQARDRSETFAKQWDEAIEAATDSMELEARRRALSGVDEPVYYQGQVVGAVRKYSDVLLIFLLKAHRPAKFRDNFSVQHSGPAGGPIEVEQTVHTTDAATWAEILRIREILGDVVDDKG